MTSEEEFEDLFWDGLQLAKNGQIEKAREIAATLRENRYSGCFEIEAVAHHEAGQTDVAIDVLREGVELSNVWRLGYLLGIYLSDEGRYDEALDAFDQCLSMKDAQPIATAANRAMVLNRSGRSEEAISSLRELLEGASPDDEPEAIEFAKDYLEDMTNGPRPVPPRRRTTKRRIGFRKQ